MTTIFTITSGMCLLPNHSDWLLYATKPYQCINFHINAFHILTLQLSVIYAAAVENCNCRPTIIAAAIAGNQHDGILINEQH